MHPRSAVLKYTLFLMLTDSRAMPFRTRQLSSFLMSKLTCRLASKRGSWCCNVQWSLAYLGLDLADAIKFDQPA